MPLIRGLSRVWVDPSRSVGVWLHFEHSDMLGARVGVGGSRLSGLIRSQPIARCAVRAASRRAEAEQMTTTNTRDGHQLRGRKAAALAAVACLTFGLLTGCGSADDTSASNIADPDTTSQAVAQSSLPTTGQAQESSMTSAPSVGTPDEQGCPAATDISATIGVEVVASADRFPGGHCPYDRGRPDDTAGAFIIDLRRRDEGLADRRSLYVTGGSICNQNRIYDRADLGADAFELRCIWDLGGGFAYQYVVLGIAAISGGSIEVLVPVGSDHAPLDDQDAAAVHDYLEQIRAIPSVAAWISRA